MWFSDLLSSAQPSAISRKKATLSTSSYFGSPYFLLSDTVKPQCKSPSICSSVVASAQSVSQWCQLKMRSIFLAIIGFTNFDCLGISASFELCPGLCRDGVLPPTKLRLTLFKVKQTAIVQPRGLNNQRKLKRWIGDRPCLARAA